MCDTLPGYQIYIGYFPSRIILVQFSSGLPVFWMWPFLEKHQEYCLCEPAHHPCLPLEWGSRVLSLSACDSHGVLCLSLCCLVFWIVSVCRLRGKTYWDHFLYIYQIFSSIARPVLYRTASQENSRSHQDKRNMSRFLVGLQVDLLRFVALSSIPLVFGSLNWFFSFLGKRLFKLRKEWPSQLRTSLLLH